uniref:Uncharacterized protein n=1 Tax=Moniliophthora roreri TaxID=221103 RepID=A0A0W0G2E5_MONRR
MSFTDSSHTAITGKNTFTHIQGNQVNRTINMGTVNINNAQRSANYTKYDQFHKIILGDIILEKELYSSWWDWKWRCGKIFAKCKAQRTIYTIEILNYKAKFTAMTYEGEDAQHVWEEDFELFAHTKNPGSFQLFGINQSTIPMLIFHNELIPLGHFYKYSFWSSLYLSHLTKNNKWESIRSVWKDMRGFLCGGPEGPNADWKFFSSADGSLVVPKKADMLKDDISFQFFCKIGSSMDNSILKCAGFSQEPTYLDDLYLEVTKDLLSNDTETPYYLYNLWQNPCYYFPMNIIGRLQFHTVYSPSKEAVARWPKGAYSLWEFVDWGQMGLVEKIVLSSGLTRFKLEMTQGKRICLRAEYNWFKLRIAWLSQSSWVFNALGMNKGEENFFLINPPHLMIHSARNYDSLPFFDFYNHKYSNKKVLPPPIYLFVHPLPESISELMSWKNSQPYFWSFDETGQLEMSEEECERWRLPKLTPQTNGLAFLSSWPMHIYAALQDWQKACGL